MKIKSSSFVLIIILLASCTPTAATIEIPSSIASIPTATPIITSTSTKQSEITYRVDEFSENYYGIVQVENKDEVFKKGWIAIYDKKSDKELIKVTSSELSFVLHGGRIIANHIQQPYGEQSLIVYEDFNFDNVKDFAIENGQNSCYHSDSFDIYLAQNGGFVFNKEFSRLAQEYCGMFHFNKGEKKIYTFQKNGCCWSQDSEFSVEDNIPIVKKIIEKEWDSPYYILTIKEWNGKEMSVTKGKHLSWKEVQKQAVFSFDLLNDGGKVVLFSLDSVTLIYALISNDEMIKFIFPTENTTDEDPRFLYKKEHSKIILRFSDNGSEYEIYEDINGNIIEKSGIWVKADGETLNLEGNIKTIQGNLMDVEKVIWGNVVFTK